MKGRCHPSIRSNRNTLVASHLHRVHVSDGCSLLQLNRWLDLWQFLDKLARLLASIAHLWDGHGAAHSVPTTANVAVSVVDNLSLQRCIEHLCSRSFFAVFNFDIVPILLRWSIFFSWWVDFNWCQFDNSLRLFSRLLSCLTNLSHLFWLILLLPSDMRVILGGYLLHKRLCWSALSFLLTLGHFSYQGLVAIRRHTDFIIFVNRWTGSVS